MLDECFSDIDDESSEFESQVYFKRKYFKN